MQQFWVNSLRRVAYINSLMILFRVLKGSCEGVLLEMGVVNVNGLLHVKGSILHIRLFEFTLFTLAAEALILSLLTFMALSARNKQYKLGAVSSLSCTSPLIISACNRHINPPFYGLSACLILYEPPDRQRELVNNLRSQSALAQTNLLSKQLPRKFDLHTPRTCVHVSRRRETLRGADSKQNCFTAAWINRQFIRCSARRLSLYLFIYSGKLLPERRVQVGWS
jgi:hypothetical protein